MTHDSIQKEVDKTIDNTPYGARKTAQQDVQFNVDPSFGLTRERYGWFSNANFFDKSFFSEIPGAIKLETGTAGTDYARIRTAFPGQYVSQSVAEPGLGAIIPSQYIERDSNNRTSLTHGEITLGAIEVDVTTETGVNTIAFSFESDATYFQIRKNNADVAKVPQKDWNIDPMDGTGPSGVVMRPEDGHVYTFPFTWYGQGAIYGAIEITEESRIIPVHKYETQGTTSIGAPNLPVQLAVQNQGTEASLGAELGGMQWTTFGSTLEGRKESGRTTKATRETGTSYIDRNVAVDVNNSIDPFAQPGRPLVSYRRNEADIKSRTALRLDTTDTFVNSSSDLYLFAFDEFDAPTALTGQNFRKTSTQRLNDETKAEVDTEATDYTPGSNAVLRSIIYVSTDKQSPSVIAGSANTRLPLEATSVLTAALPTGSNSAGARPVISTIREGY